MTTTRTIRQTVNALVGTYRKEIAAAAGNSVLSKAEEKKLTPFAQRHIRELREEGDSVTVGKAVAHLRPVIERAAEAIAGRDGKIDAADVRKLRVTELRVRAASLFEGEATGGLADLKKAIKATEIDAITDYGKSFSLQNFPAGATLKSMIASITDTDAADLGNVEDSYSLTQGAAAVRDMAKAVKDAGASHAEGSDDEAGARVITRAYDGVAAGVQGFFKSSEFKKFILAEHSIAEDGDMEYHVLLAQKRDGAWTTLTYSDFPF